MTDDWDFYGLQADQAPAAIHVDLGAIAMAPEPGLPHLAWLSLDLAQPRADGLPAAVESDDLVRIEDTLQAELVDAHTAYVGHRTGHGQRQFFFYVAHDWSWADRCATTLATFPAYRHEAGTRADPGWDTYRTELYPSDEQLLSIENRRICAALQSHGDRLRTARAIHHRAWLPDVRSCRVFVDTAEEEGYRVEPLAWPGAEAARHPVRLWRIDVPDLAGIDGLTLPLLRLATFHGGGYEGWECEVLA